MDILKEARAFYAAGKNLPGFSAKVNAKVSALVDARLDPEHRVRRTTSFAVDGHSFTLEEYSLEEELRIFTAVQSFVTNGVATSSKTRVKFS